jgi:hypothetical protein
MEVLIKSLPKQPSAYSVYSANAESYLLKSYHSSKKSVKDLDVEKIYIWMSSNSPGQEVTQVSANKLDLQRCFIVHASDEV